MSQKLTTDASVDSIWLLQGERVTVTGLLLRYLAGYAGLMAVLGIFHFYFLPIGLTGFGTGMMVAAFMLLEKLCSSFGKRNHRNFTAYEKNLVAIGVIVTNMGVQLALLSQSPFFKNPDTPDSTIAIVVGLYLLCAWGLYYGVNVPSRRS